MRHHTRTVRISITVFIVLLLFGCAPGPFAVMHLTQDQKRMIKRKGASKHYFLSKVICFDRQCRSFTGYVAKRNKQRFKGFKDKEDSYIYRKREPRQDSTIASNKIVEQPQHDHFQLDTPTLFKNANFETNSIQLQLDFLPELNDLANYLLSNPSYKVRISGHTDDIGSAEFNQILSRDRAQEVVDYLIDQGIEANRLLAIGRGNSQPLDKRDTANARRKNRRVEFEIITDKSDRQK